MYISRNSGFEFLLIYYQCRYRLFGILKLNCNVDGFLLIDKFGVFGILKCLVYIFDFIILEWISFKKDGGNFIKGYQVEKREAGEIKWIK